jgi:septation ring formation regulator EzrA
MIFNVLEEYKQHNDFLIELNKEKNAELNELRETVKRHDETYSYLQAKVERYEEALRYIAGESHVYADTLEEARESAITALDDDEWEGE